MSQNEKSLLSVAEEAFENPDPAVQVSGSPPQRAHTTTNRT